MWGSGTWVLTSSIRNVVTFVIYNMENISYKFSVRAHDLYCAMTSESRNSGARSHVHC
jgi:hypothetical protein